ncbi:MAG: SAM-dependent methyltransferase [Bacteroidetes bacterium CG23_combo_of_CG06-09_8_20_14_all_32_9]|nr:MAG: SAM-dependent methyltransferase [Bacteroidetes bacterium CG23_combo_of_CG06-09_8_20_14_all_32_9]
MKGKLFLIPTPLGENFTIQNINSDVIKTLQGIRFLIAEELKTARRFLKKLDPSCPIDDITFFVLNEHTTPQEFEQYLKVAENGNNVGLLTEAGCPAIADPGSQVVNIAHKNEIKVVPLVGPSSITLALMASGLNGQKFAFWGYLPVKQNERKIKIKQIEKRSKLENQTQIFIETPYRNISLFNDIIAVCEPETQLCIASNITQYDEFILTMKIKKWKLKIPDIHKKPTVFLLLS